MSTIEEVSAVRVVIAVSGTRGDVQPAVLLGIELAGRGHRVVMAVPPNLASFARGAGLEAVELGYDTREHMNSDLVRHGVSRGSIIERARAVATLWNFGWDEMVRDMTEIVDDVRPDVIVTGIMTEQIALPLAQRCGAGLVSLHHAPVRANGRYSAIPGWEGLPRIVTEASWSLLSQALWAATRCRENRLRRNMGLPTVWSPLPGRMAKYGCAEIQAYDTAFCPELEAEWGARRPFVGFLEMSSAQRSTMDPTEPDDAIEAWIDGGSPPVYVGFGSMPVSNPEAAVAAAALACARLGQRALISAGWNDVDTADHGDHVLVTGTVDHETVFPRCRAVVHHGGAGSTAAGIRAGRPTVICSIASDQPFWGRRMVEHSCGAAMPFADLSADSLEAALRIALTPESAAGARRLSDAMTAPDAALGRAADLVESAHAAAAANRTPAEKGAW
ncbi:MAG: glycosyltransferase [Rhodococcus sp. (in: high G+C Gram-positive bacteria)]